MRKARPLFLILFALFVFSPIYAQDWWEGDDQYEDEFPEDDNDFFMDTMWSPFIYARGDQMFSISLGIVLPTVFTGSSGGTIIHNLSPGPVLSLAYHHFLTPNLFVGGELSGTAMLTIGQNWLYLIPFGFKVGYQFTLHRFNLPLAFRRVEIPLSLTIGGAAHSYLDNQENYFGFFMKPVAGLYFRFNQDWSFGISTAWWWVPQWNEDRSKNVNGHFMDILISARYHF